MSINPHSDNAKKIGAYLKGKGHKVPHTLLLEALARADGFANRHHAKEKSGESVLRSDVWVLAITHRHGTNHSAHLSEDDAHDELYAYVLENWEKEIGKMPVDAATNRQGLVSAYFEKMAERMGEESYIVEKVPVYGHVPTVALVRPEFAPDKEISLHETLQFLSSRPGLIPKGHEENLAKLRDALDPSKDDSVVKALADDFLNERGLHIAHAASVNDVCERLEIAGALTGAADDRAIVQSALTEVCGFHGMSESAIISFNDQVDATFGEFSKDDETAPGGP